MSDVGEGKGETKKGKDHAVNIVRKRRASESARAGVRGITSTGGGVSDLKVSSPALFFFDRDEERFEIALPEG
jgi:hypothetical protein